MSLGYAGHSIFTVYFVHDRAQFEVVTEADRQRIGLGRERPADGRDVLQRSGRAAVARVLTAAPRLVLRYSSLVSTSTSCVVTSAPTRRRRPMAQPMQLVVARR